MENLREFVAFLRILIVGRQKGDNEIIMINIWCLPFVLPAALDCGDTFRFVLHLTGMHIPILQFISKSDIRHRLLSLHTEASGGRVPDWHFSSGATWKGRMLFPERLLVMLCLSVHTLWATAQSKMHVGVGRGRGTSVCRRGLLSSETAPGRLDFLFHDEAVARQGCWLCNTTACSRGRWHS